MFLAVKLQAFLINFTESVIGEAIVLLAVHKLL